MRVGIDATYLLVPQKTGVETYTLNLLRALLNLADRPEVYLYAAGREPPDTGASAILAAAERTRLSRLPRLWLRLRMPLALALDRVHLAHFPGTILPPFLPCPAVTTFYDLAAFRLPELYDEAELKLYRQAIPAAARRAGAVIAISESTKRDLVELLHLPEEKITVTPLGVAPGFRPVADAVEQAAEAFGLRAPYLLANVGSAHPRKNLSAVVTAFNTVAEPELELAIVGAVERDTAALREIERSPRRRHINLLGYVPAEQLPLLYSAATIFCFPSLYEGFGLPVLEAMSCGAPVICSNSSSLPEVAGGAAMLIDPHEADDLAAAVSALLGDAERRRELSQAALARAAHFSWQRTAKLTLEAYRRALAD